LEDKNAVEVIKTSTTVTPWGGGGGCSNWKGSGGWSGCPQCTYRKRMGDSQESCYSLHGFPDKAGHVSKS